MNLRKVVLTLTLIMLLVLMFISFSNYTQYQDIVKLAAQVDPEVGKNNFDALLFWMQFPLLLLIASMLTYMIFGDESLTRQLERSRK